MVAISIFGYMIDYNTAVFTLKSITDKTAAISYVVHDEDNEWQFLHGEEVSVSDMQIISLKQILNIDVSLKAIIETLPEGHYALKENNKWTFHKIEEEE